MAKRNNGYTHLSQEDFDNIKLLQQAGLTQVKAAGLTGRSRSTMYLVYKANSLEEYQAARRAMRAKRVESGQPILIPEFKPGDVADMFRLLINMSELLTDMDHRLKYIEEHIEIRLKRKFF